MSFSHCLPAGKIKRWVFLTGPKSLLSSPLTVPMATSSSGAADGGCRPTSSTWPHKVGACVELRAGLCCCDSSCRQTENGPLLPAALQRALLAYKDIYKCDSVLRWHSRSSRRSCHKSLHQLTCLVSYRSYHGHSSFSSWPWNRAVWKRMGKQLGGSMMSPPNAWICLRHSCRRSADSLPATQQFPRILFTRHKGVSERLRQRRGMQLWQLWVRGETLILAPQQRWHHIVTITKTQNTEMLL